MKTQDICVVLLLLLYFCVYRIARDFINMYVHRFDLFVVSRA